MVLKMKQSSKKVMADYNIHKDSVTFTTLFGFYKERQIPVGRDFPPVQTGPGAQWVPGLSRG